MYHKDPLQDLLRDFAGFRVTLITEEKLRGLFESKGEITDLQLKYTKAGVFRRFAFVGFRSNTDAKAAVDFYHNTFIGATRIKVQEAKDLTSSEKPRPWSKYSEGSSAYKKKHSKGTEPTPEPNQKPEKKTEKKPGLDLGELQDDPGFKEFLEVHRLGDQAKTWANDAAASQKTGLVEDGEEAENKEMEVEAASPGEVTEELVKKKKKSKKKKKDKKPDDGEQESVQKTEVEPALSDMEYLRSKMTKKPEVSESKASLPSEPVRKSVGSKGLLVEVKTTEKYHKGEHVVRVTGVKRNFTEEDIVNFFAPLSIKVIRSVLNANGRSKGKLYVEFSSEEDVVQAVMKHKQYLGSRYLQVVRDTPAAKGKQDGGSTDTKIEGDQKEKAPWEQQAEELKTSDDQVAETGRLFVRNLAYMCSETDLEQLFSAYGPLTEVNLPIDKLTKKSKGFAFVTFMMPEHAVKAYTELDGTNFMGRLMHILPGKEKVTNEKEEQEGSSFKNQKAAKQKAQSGSSHNWNTLFIGSNAVADALASKYNTTKRAVLDPDAKGSLGVRMALGETQLVAETRQFLVDNGVALDSFSQPSAARSKTVMLAKNLPAGTESEELKELFAAHGQLGKVLLPPAGVTAIIEMLEPSEARVAFYNLAYTKFHHVPLYLEWAPMDVFSGSSSGTARTQEIREATEIQDTETTKEDMGEGKDTLEEGAGTRDQAVLGDGEQEGEEEGEEEEESEPESTLFIKNINFETVEETLEEVFSKCGRVKSVVISKKKDPYKSDELLSMGFGFVEYFKRDHAMRALRELQHTQVDEHQIELKISNRTNLQKQQVSARKSASRKKQTSSKIMVRNIPFEAQVQEIRDLFSTFGEIKYVRLPKKMSGTGSHRGFGFVEFLTKQDAKRAFDALCHSSHLFGRRLVLEWAEEDESVDRLRKRTADRFSEGGVKTKLKKSKLKEDLAS